MSNVMCPGCGRSVEVDVDAPEASCPHCRASLFGPAVSSPEPRSDGTSPRPSPWARKWLIWMAVMLAAWGGIGGFLMRRSAQAVHESLDEKSPDAKAIHPVTGRETRVADLLSEMDAEIFWFIVGHVAIVTILIVLALLPKVSARLRILSAGVVYALLTVALGIAFPGTIGSGIIFKVIFFATFAYALKGHRSAV